MPEIAIVVPTYNRADVLPRALRSVLQSGMQQLEVIVVDDASTDATASVIEALGDGRVRYELLPRKSNGNVARNRGIQLTRSPIVAFLDSDDAFEPGRVERLSRYFSEHPDIDGVVDGFTVIAGGRSGKAKVQPDVVAGDRLADLLIKHAVPLTCSSIAVRRMALDRIQGFDETLPRQQDRDLLLRLSTRHTMAFGTGNDVMKYRSRDSLSHNPVGYIASLDELVRRHPRFRDKQFNDLLSYLTCRLILKSLLGGKFRAGLSELQALKRSSNLPRSLFAGLLRYNRGRHARESHHAGEL